MVEIVNMEEVERIVGRMEPESGHGPLMDALSRRYPCSEINLISMSAFHQDIGALIDRRGETVAENYEMWVTGEYRAAGGDAKAVYRKYVETRMAISELQGERVVVTIPDGDQPEDFMQMEIVATRKIAERLLLDSFEPDGLDDLLHSSSCLNNPQILSPWRYGVRRVTNVRTFLSAIIDHERARRRTEFPEQDCKAQVTDEMFFRVLHPRRIDELPEYRFIQDWRESSAGLSGARLCAHWWLDVADTRSYGGGLSYVPRWADSDCKFPHVSLGGRFDPSPCSITSPLDYSLSRVEASEHRSIYTLMAALEEYDSKAGYPMAWYFFMLHGNRVGQGVGDAVAKAIGERRIALPEHDARVLARWRANSYGF